MNFDVDVVGGDSEGFADFFGAEPFEVQCDERSVGFREADHGLVQSFGGVAAGFGVVARFGRCFDRCGGRPAVGLALHREQRVQGHTVQPG